MPVFFKLAGSVVILHRMSGFMLHAGFAKFIMQDCVIPTKNEQRITHTFTQQDQESGGLTALTRVQAEAIGPGNQGIPAAMGQ